MRLNLELIQWRCSLLLLLFLFLLFLVDFESLAKLASPSVVEKVLKDGRSTGVWGNSTQRIAPKHALSNGGKSSQLPMECKHSLLWSYLLSRPCNLWQLPPYFITALSPVLNAYPSTFPLIFIFYHSLATSLIIIWLTISHAKVFDHLGMPESENQRSTLLLYL